MSLLLAACIRRAAAGRQQPAQEARHLAHYHAFCSLLDASPLDARMPIAHYAAQLGLSPKLLNESIRQASGRTCVALLQDRLLTEAKRRLLYTGESCKEIAYALAFRDCSYFSRFFRKGEGMTPVEFKAHWEEKYHQRA
jgi:AraC family transcriptional activator of pobA